MAASAKRARCPTPCATRSSAATTSTRVRPRTAKAERRSLPDAEGMRSQTLGALIDEMAATRPSADAVIFRGDRLSFAALRERADTLVRALLALGVYRGDRVAILLPNRPEWLIAAVAAAKVGAVTAAISTFSTARELAWTLEHAQPRVVVTMAAFRGHEYLRAIADLCPELARAEPGALRSERVPELRAVVSIDDRHQDG